VDVAWNHGGEAVNHSDEGLIHIAVCDSEGFQQGSVGGSFESTFYFVASQTSTLKLCSCYLVYETKNFVFRRDINPKPNPYIMPPFSYYLRGHGTTFSGFWEKITEENSKLAKKK